MKKYDIKKELNLVVERLNAGHSLTEILECFLIEGERTFGWDRALDAAGRLELAIRYLRSTDQAITVDNIVAACKFSESQKLFKTVV
jgi:hypothetical protein